MDNTPYSTVGSYGTSNPNHYPSPVYFSPHCSPPDSSLPQTLRPLQPSSITTIQPSYGSKPHSLRTGTPETPNSAHNLPNYHQSTQASARSDMHPIAQNLCSRPMMTGAAMAAPCGPAVLRPMSPAHVVGSQGRRGILPSAPGRPAAPAAGTSAAKNMVISAKDTDGKFPCPHCIKTYLHAKHLKRHLLRHTGDRPYMCVLCRDTFSHSDILKRHFQKCSIRRGNPTGASHLSHLRAHVKKDAPAQKAAGMPEGDMSQMNGMPGDGMVHPFGMVPVQDGMNGMPDQHQHQHQLSRSSSMGRVASPANGDRRGSQFNRGVVNSTNGQNMHDYDVPPGQSGSPMYGAENDAPQSSLGWAQMFPRAGPQNSY